MANYTFFLDAVAKTSYPAIQKDPEILQGRLKDAAGNAGSVCQGVFLPTTEAELASFLAEDSQRLILPQGARTSLTGGATPQGDILIGMDRFQTLVLLGSERIRVGAGVYLKDLLAFLQEKNLYYPPTPTFDGATVGGTVSTNAAGASTFKYGTTRDWVEAFRMVLRHGEVLALKRGQCFVKPGDQILLQGQHSLVFSIPSYETPPLKKISAGYYVRNPMDLMDFFIGSEGTLGIFTEVELRVVPRKKTLTGVVFFTHENDLLACTKQLRDASLKTWETRDPLGIDIRSIEYVDGNALQLLRTTQSPALQKISVPISALALILFEMELENSWTRDHVQQDLEAVFEGSSAVDSPVFRLGNILKRFQVLEEARFAFPEEIEKHKQLTGIREAVPMTVNEWILRQQHSDPEIHKCGGDFIVPFEFLEKMLPFYRETFQNNGLSFAIWGHLSDGNLHPNILAKNREELQKGKDSFLKLTQEVKKYGGCPLSEHGVGKNPMKQEMLKSFYGEQVIQEMKTIKQCFDPVWTLARGVLFPPPESLEKKS